LAKLAAEDPSFGISTDPESGQTVLKGMDELKLGIKVDILRRTCEVDTNRGSPQVAYRERVTRRAEVDYTHKKPRQYARVKFIVEPNEPGKGFEFDCKVAGGAIPQEHIAGVEKGLNSVLGFGVVAGFPVVDVKVQLVDGAYHEIDSSALAFEIASRAAFRDALLKAESVLLEPVMKVEVMTPKDYVAAVIDDLHSRDSRIYGQELRGNVNIIDAEVPLCRMFGYLNKLHSMSQGRATFTMQFDHYAPTPRSTTIPRSGR
jgi:elongation factor G